MRLEKVTLRNFRCYETLSLNFAAGFTILVAPNGRGKTSILDGIAAGFVGAWPEFRIQGKIIASEDFRIQQWALPNLPPEQATDVRIQIEVEQDGSALQWTVVRYMDNKDARLEGKSPFHDLANRVRNGDQIALPLIAHYGVTRFPRRQREESDLEQHDIDLKASLTSATVASRLAGWNSSLGAGAFWEPLERRWSTVIVAAQASHTRGRDAAVSQAVAEAVKIAAGSSEDPVYSGDARDIAVLFNDEGWRTVGILSDGWRAFLAMVADIALRIAELNPHIPDPCSKCEGVVLIDEVDLHFHPAMQREVLTRLRRTFRRLQFVVSTHSGLTLTDVDPALDRIYRIDVAPGTPPSITQLAPPPPGTNADAIFTGEWFEQESTFDRGTEALIREHWALVRAGRDQQNEKRREELEAELRHRLTRYSETSLEEFVVSIAAELTRGLHNLSHSDLARLRDRIISKIRSALGEEPQ